MDFDITTVFGAMVSTPWSRVNPMTPLQRAQCFVVPFEEDLARLEFAKSLVIPVLQGRETASGARSKYARAFMYPFEAEAFYLAANFYHGCLCGARDFLQCTDPDIRDAWPALKYDTCEDCHKICRLLTGKTFQRESPAIRTFLPPWHFGCWGFVTDSDRECSKGFSLSVPPNRINYFHNPIDVLVSRRLIDDFVGIDTVVTNSTATDLAGVRAYIERLQIC